MTGDPSRVSALRFSCDFVARLIALVRGPVGTSVELTFLRDDTRHVISVERANVVVPVASWQMVTYHDLRIGHLTLTRFTEGSGDKLRAEVRAAVDAGARGLIAGSQIPRR